MHMQGSGDTFHHADIQKNIVPFKEQNVDIEVQARQ